MEENKNTTSKEFQVLCKHCKKLIKIPKDDNLINICKEYVKESHDKYKWDYAISKKQINGCTECGKDIIINCKSYIDFYNPEKAKKAEEIMNKVAESISEEIKQDASTEPITK